MRSFDTINPNKLLKRLDSRFGIRGTALAWIRSYLSDRTQTVVINGLRSSDKELNTGVPQGSVLGPLLFTLYVSPIADIARKHGLDVHSYADDTQLYVSFAETYGISVVSRLNSEIPRIEKCLADVRYWMLSNFLKINDDKTEFLLISSRFSRLQN